MLNVKVKSLIAAAVLALPIAAPAQADLSEILSEGVIKIAVPESLSLIHI